MSVSTETHRPPAPHWHRGAVSRWVLATDHKQVGLLWLAVAGLGTVLTGIVAVVAQAQVARPDSDVLGAGTFASLTTMHGTLLAYLVLLPLAMGLAVFLVPLQIGAKALAHQGAVAFAFWLGAFGALAVVLSGLGSGDGARSYWSTVPHLALDPDRASERVRLLGLLLLGIAVLVTAVALVATIRSRRAPDMRLEDTPIFTLSVGAFAVVEVILSSVFLIGTALLLLERRFPGSFDWYLDGDSLRGAYEWVFQQGIVLVALVPALGIAAEIVAAFARSALTGRRVVVVAVVAAAALVVLVPGVDDLERRRAAVVLALVAATAAAAAVVALLSVALRSLRGTTLGGPLGFAIASLAFTLVGWVSTLLEAAFFDDLHGTSFSGARNVAFASGALFAFAGGIAYWSPKLWGRFLSFGLLAVTLLLGAVSTTLVVVGDALAGIDDQPLRAAVLDDGAGSGGTIATIGLVGAVAAVGLFLIAVLRSRNGRRAGNDPWGADTLEWLTTSPPPASNFTMPIPPVTSPRPLYDLRERLKEKGAL